MVDLGAITCGSDGKESACNVGDLGLVPGLGRSPGEGKGYPLPVLLPREFHGLYSPWVAKSWIQLSNFHFGTDTKGTFHAKMGSIKDRNGMDLTEAEDIKKRWQEYTEELYKKIFTTQIIMMV